MFRELSHREAPPPEKRRLGSSGPFAKIALVSVCASFFELFACGAKEPAAPATGRGPFFAHSPPSCDADETREYYCDELAPLRPGRGGPPPFDDCPVQVESHESFFERVPPVAVLDPSYTDYTRRRTPPGHGCCYSWCNPIAVAEPNPNDAFNSCRTPLAFREKYCVDEPEAGTKVPASASHPKCPAALVPPEKAVFSAPKAALFDDRITSERRGEGFVECCYSWCSEAPPTSGLQGSGPR